MPHKQVSNNHKEGLVMYLATPLCPHLTEANCLPSPMVQLMLDPERECVKGTMLCDLFAPTDVF